MARGKSVINPKTIREMTEELEIFPKLHRVIVRDAANMAWDYYRRSTSRPGLAARFTDTKVPNTSAARWNARENPGSYISKAYGFAVRGRMLGGRNEYKAGAAFVRTGAMQRELMSRKGRSPTGRGLNSKGDFSMVYSINHQSLNLMGNQRGLISSSPDVKIVTYEYMSKNGARVNVSRRQAYHKKERSAQTYRSEWEFKPDELQFMSAIYMRMLAIAKRNTVLKQFNKKGRIKASYRKKLAASRG